MKYKILLLIVLISAKAHSQTEKVNIGGQNFVITHTRISTDRDVTHNVIHLYRTDTITNKKSLIFKHTILLHGGDSSSQSFELGKYTIADSSITFYSFWCKQGDSPTLPFGARKQIYSINDKGQLVLTESRLYLEKCSSYWGERDGCEGMKFLFEQAKTKAEKQLFRQYIENVQKEYNATFVFGKQSDQLLNEVRLILKEDIDKYTHYWSKLDNSFGYKK